MKTCQMPYDSRASPTITFTFLMLCLANDSSAILAYSDENSRAVTWPSDPTAEDQPIAENPMNVPISSTIMSVSINREGASGFDRWH